MTKPRPDAFYAKLSEKETDDLFQAARGLSLAAGCALAKEKFGLKCSKSSLSRFLKAYAEDAHREIRAALQATAERAKDLSNAAPIPPRVIADSLRALGARMVELGDAETAVKYLTVAASQDRIAADMEKLALDREKFEAAERRLADVQDAVKSAKSKGGLTAETLKKIEEAAGLL